MTTTFDPLTRDERAAEIARPRPRTHLALAPLAAPARAAPAARRRARPVDRRRRPIYAVWEITLACDLACRHCGSRAGHARPDELTTAEALDLVDQMAELGVQGGDAHRRRGVPARRLARHRPRDPRARDECTMTTGGRGLTPRARRTARRRRGSTGASVSIDGDEATHDRLRGVAGLVPRGVRGDAARCARRAARRRATRRSTGSRCRCSSDDPRDDRRRGMHRLADPAHRRDGARGRRAGHPAPALRSARALPAARAAQDALRRARRCASGRATTSATSARTSRSCAGTTPAGTAARAARGARRSASRPTAPSRAARRCRRARTTGGNIRDASLEDIWERASRCASRATARLRDLWGYCRTCYYAEECMSGCTWTSFVTFGKAGQQPVLPPPRARAGSARASASASCASQAAPGEPFDHGRFEIVVEDLEPAK